MTRHSTDFVSALYTERSNIISAQGLLSRRLTALDAVLAVYQPQPRAAQTGPATVPVVDASAEQASVESSAPNSPDGASEEVGGFPVAAAPQNSGATGGDEGDQTSQPVNVGGTSDATAGETAPHSETPAQQPGSEAAVADADPAPAGEASRPDASPAPVISKREQVRITHEDHPEWTSAQVAEHLGLTRGSVSGHASALGIKFAPAAPTTSPSPAVRKAERVRLMHEQHPTWTARMIANQLGEKETTVSTLLAGARKQVAKASPAPEFAGKAEMVSHYDEVAKRLGKV